jgi:aspartate/methionine/tyrosine aminotransferase
MQQPLYLMWARETAAWLGANPDAYDLFSSAIQTPHALMERHIEAHGALDLLTGGGKLSASWGHPAFTGALARIYGVDDPARILVTAGASNAYLLVVRALVAPGDHVILETPVYEPFVTVPTDQGAAITYLERRPSQNYALDVDALAAAVTPQTRLIVITNLHNPSGALTGAETLHQVADVARRVGAYVLVDEVYRDLAGAAAPCAAALSPDVFITISSATKAYGLGTVRAGWVIAPPELVPLLREKHVTYECSLSQIGRAHV